jgi:hypothetical protein
MNVIVQVWSFAEKVCKGIDLHSFKRKLRPTHPSRNNYDVQPIKVAASCNKEGLITSRPRVYQDAFVDAHNFPIGILSAQKKAGTIHMTRGMDDFAPSYAVMAHSRNRLWAHATKKHFVKVTISILLVPIALVQDYCLSNDSDTEAPREPHQKTTCIAFASIDDCCGRKFCKPEPIALTVFEVSVNVVGIRKINNRHPK